MKKVFLIGKISDTIDEINKSLEPHFNVHLCPTKLDNVKDMIKIVKPDLVVVTIIEPMFYYIEILEWLNHNMRYLPMLVITTQLRVDQVMQNPMLLHHSILLMPYDENDLLDKCYKALKIDKDGNPITVIPATPKRSEVKKKVLVIDDNAIVLRTTKNMLKEYFDVLLSTNGMLGLNKMLNEHPDIVLLDYEMPGMTGLAVYEEMQKIEECKDIPVIFLTAVSDRNRVNEVIMAKPAGYLLKPTSKEQMIGTIDAVLSRRS